MKYFQHVNNSFIKIYLNIYSLLSRKSNLQHRTFTKFIIKFKIHFYKRITIYIYKVIIYFMMRLIKIITIKKYSLQIWNLKFHKINVCVIVIINSPNQTKEYIWSFVPNEKGGIHRMLVYQEMIKSQLGRWTNHFNHISPNLHL